MSSCIILADNKVRWYGGRQEMSEVDLMKELPTQLEILDKTDIDLKIIRYVWIYFSFSIG